MWVLKCQNLRPTMGVVLDCRAGEKVKMKVGKLSSAKTHLPYNYYDLPFCRPKGVTTTPAVSRRQKGEIAIRENSSVTGCCCCCCCYLEQNLGEVLAGDLMHNTNYEFFMKRNESCKILCTVRNFHVRTAQIAMLGFCLNTLVSLKCRRGS